MPWWSRHVPQVEMLSRPGCHLCDEMLQVLQGQRLEVTVRDIDAERVAGAMSEAEHARWSTEVPVLLMDGEAVARWRTDAGEVRAALAARRGAARRR
ncbi:glutaredoxin family protein [Serinicoccus kebangsaanensis]|uniref:glutaredoxin family protein n=1 Tax=Serinicoccus kebangsaanensis TaxID=2602069 RepID=UPI00124DA68B|nr:glutaredoxin family protein [Serinicoccus kebangsaanensis]